MKASFAEKTMKRKRELETAAGFNLTILLWLIIVVSNDDM